MRSLLVAYNIPLFPHSSSLPLRFTSPLGFACRTSSSMSLPETHKVERLGSQEGKPGTRKHLFRKVLAPIGGQSPKPRNEREIIPSVLQHEAACLGALEYFPGCEPVCEIKARSPQFSPHIAIPVEEFRAKSITVSELQNTVSAGMDKTADMLERVPDRFHMSQDPDTKDDVEPMIWTVIHQVRAYEFATRNVLRRNASAGSTGRPPSAWRWREMLPRIRRSCVSWRMIAPGC
jgi:hypothetical protein